MTLFNFDDDQMVPQVNLQDVLGGSSNTNLDTINTPTLLKPIPDFESLLTGLTECPSWNDPETADFMYPMGDPSDGYRMLSDFDRPVHDQDLTLYDDTPAGLTIKKEKLTLEELTMSTHQPRTTQQLLPSEDTARTPEACDEVQNDFDAVTREIDGVCALLNIPVAPYQWSVEQVTKWAIWTLEQYKLPACYLYDLQIDGSTLCLLTEQDFRARWPQFGEYLYAQLEFWKGAYYSLKAEPNTQDVYEDQPTYMDLTPISQACSQHQPQQHQPQQHQPQQHQPQQHQPQPAYVPLASSLTSPTSSSCHQTQPLCHNDLMMSSMATAIPKPVLTTNLGCNLSPASSLDSMDSFASSPASETEYCDRSFGGPRLHHETRSEVTPSKQNIHLWQFLRELLIQQHNYGAAIRWLDRTKGIFKIEDSARVAKLWGQRKNRPAMNYDKLSRSIRQYYKKGIIKKTDNSKRLVYQFCPQYRV